MIYPGRLPSSSAHDQETCESCGNSAQESLLGFTWKSHVYAAGGGAGGLQGFSLFLLDPCVFAGKLWDVLHCGFSVLVPGQKGSFRVPKWSVYAGKCLWEPLHPPCAVVLG